MNECARLALVLAALTTGSTWAGPFDVLLGRAPPVPQTAQEAFGLRVVGSGPEARLELDIARGHYLYRDRLSARVVGGEAELTLRLPPGDRTHDESFGITEVYRGRVEVPTTLPAGADAVEVNYQGCVEGRLCYPPARRVLTVEPS